MTTTVTWQAPSPPTDVASTRRLSRLGYLAAGVGLLALTLAGAGGLPRMPFVIALLAIDVPALLACLGQPAGPRMLPRRAVAVYNLTHRLAGPLALLSIGAAITHPAVLASALGWTAHITLDRAAGYTLRNPDGSLR